ncbi:MAG: MCE family protein [Solirubrobacterales bacterium]|nr:MCE family protein [Solirubrobacterales bacterium]
MATKQPKTRSGLAASPTMIGAVTTLIAIVAIFLAYNANQGLPFVPTYRVSVEVPNAARLTDANEVRIGGNRVGIVDSIDPVMVETDTRSAQTGGDPSAVSEGETGGVVAQLNLKLDESVAPIPKDSIFRIRYRSSFGLKFLEIIRGTGDAAPEGFTFIGTDDEQTCELPTASASEFAAQVEGTPAANGCFQEQVEFDDIYNTFNNQTRRASQTNLAGFGSGFAARGVSLNETVRALPTLFRNLKPVMTTLADPDTKLSRFVNELADSARVVAPIAEQNSTMFTYAADTFTAFSSSPTALQETISEGPPTLETGIRLLPRQRPFLRDFTTLTRELRPGVADLRPTLPVLNSAIDVGTPVLLRSPGLNKRLEDNFRAIRSLVSEPSTKLALERLGGLFDEVKPLARYIAPVQTTCNYVTYWGNFLSNAFSAKDSTGFTTRQTISTVPPGEERFDTSAIPDPPPPLPPIQNETVVPGEVETPIGGYSGLQANGRAGAALDPPDGGEFRPFELPILYAQGYAPTGQDGKDCQTGQNGYLLGQLRAPGQRRNNPAIAVSNLPGSRGPTSLYWTKGGKRRIVDSRVASRQPGSWRNVP